MAVPKVCSVEGCGKPRKQHPLYNAYWNMLRRCYDKNHRVYHHYGGRGILVCERWRNDFWAFVSDMGERPSSKHSLGRINNDKGYYPGNVEWQTDAQQKRNTRRNIPITINGRTQVAIDWAAEKGIPWITVYERINRGWNLYDAVMKPPRKTSRIYHKKSK